MDVLLTPITEFTS